MKRDSAENVHGLKDVTNITMKELGGGVEACEESYTVGKVCDMSLS